MLSSFTLAALDLVFPALCPVCQTLLGPGRRDPLCGTCWSAITRLGDPWCHVCGAASPTARSAERGESGEWVTQPAAWAASAVSRCAMCTGTPPHYDYARSAAVYEGQLREALHALKFSGRRALAVRSVSSRSSNVSRRCPAESRR